MNSFILAILFYSFATIACRPFGKSFFPKEHLDKNQAAREEEKTSVDNPVISDTLSNPFLTDHANKSFPGNYLKAGNTLTVDYDNLYSQSDSGMSYQCFFDEIANQSVSDVTSCSSLPGSATFSSSTGILVWTPSILTHASFDLKIVGTNSFGTSIRYLIVSVVPAINYQNLVAHWDARFADRLTNVSTSYSSWLDLGNNVWNGSLSNTSSVYWQGSSSALNPYHLRFSGGGSVNFGDSVLNQASKMMFSTWVESAIAASSNESVIFSNNLDASGNGFMLKQKASYQEYVMSLSPVGYWRLSESTGTTATDMSGYGNHGSYVNGVTLNQAGSLTNDENNSITLDGTNDYIDLGSPSSLKFGSGNFTYNAWIRTSAGATTDLIIADSNNAVAERALSKTGNFVLMSCRDASGNAANATSTAIINDGQWHMVTGVRSGINVYVYVDGRLSGSASNASMGNCDSPVNINVGTRPVGAGLEFQGNIDEVSLFASALSASTVYQLYTAGRRGKQLDFVIGADYRSIIDASAPLSRFLFDETSGTVAQDAGSLANHGTYLSGAVINQNGAIASNTNRSAQLDGSNDTISIPHHASYNVGTGDFSVEFWVKVNLPILTTQEYGLVNKNAMFQGSNGWGVEIATYGSPTNYASYRFYVTSQATWCNTCVYGPDQLMGNWNHIVGVRGSGFTKLYVDGVLIGTTTHSDTNLNVDNTQPIVIGDHMWGPFAPMNIDEFQFYNYALSDSQIIARYNAGVGGGICSTNTAVLDGIWNHVSGLFDGSTMSLFVNGRQACTTSSVPSRASSPSSSFTAGATHTQTKSFIGKISDILLYATNDGSSVATSSDIKSNFAIHADSFRKSPQKNLVTNGLVFHVDAANAKQGVSPRDNGCANYDLSWFDLGTTMLSTTFTNFTNCGVTTGWNGDGTTTISGSAGPYRLSFDGVDDYLAIPDSATTSPGTGAHSVASWVNIADSCATTPLIFLEYGNPFQNAVWMACYPGGNFNCTYRDGSNNLMTITSSATFNDGKWHHVQCVRDSQTSLVFYIDGVQVGSTSNASVGNIILNNAHPGGIGAWTQTALPATQFWRGEIASFSIYNRGLTSSEVIQNCNAYKDRFANASCP